MGRNCTICIHPAKNDIDAALEGAQPLRDIAAQFGVSKTALHRHWQVHVSGQTAGQATQPPSRTGASTATQRRSLLRSYAKWGLAIAGGWLAHMVWDNVRRLPSPE